MRNEEAKIRDFSELRIGRKDKHEGGIMVYATGTASDQ